MDIKWIGSDALPEELPDAERALVAPNGLLAAGGSLSPEWLLAAYPGGIFPWFEEGQPILWWSPDPRAVLYPRALRVSRSLRKTIRRGTFEITADRAFAEVIAACAAPRSGTDSRTWITRAMERAYIEMHRLGWAHSFEAWHDGMLVGGLYGVGIGGAFFGESMFSRMDDASKTALVAAVGFFVGQGIELIDCQMQSPHMSSLGAESIPRVAFLEELRRLCSRTRPAGSWENAFETAHQGVATGL